MADDILINTGTGVTIWTDQSGTRHAQVVKVSIGADSTHNLLAFGQSNMTNSLPVVLANDQSILSVTATGVTIANITTGTVTALPSGTQNVNVVNVLSATGVLIANITTGTVTALPTGTQISNLGTAQYGVASTNLGTTGDGVLIIGIQSGATTARGMAIHTTGGLIVASMPAVGGGQQYSQAATVNATGTGTLFLGVAENTAQPLLIHTTGGLVIASMPAVGGGQQYSIDTTGIAATGTGTLMIGIQSGATTAKGVVVTTTGGLIIGAMPAVGGGVQYTIDTTTINATGTGTLMIGIQSGATTARGIALTTTGAQHVNVQNVLSASGVTIATISNPVVITASANPLIVSTVSTVLTLPVLSASGVTIASITTGTVNIVSGTITTVLAMPVLSATGVLLAATTASVGAFVGTAHASRWDAYAVNTTSGASVIVKTSGAHTLYITDMILSVDMPARVDIFSAATTKLSLYLATKGGFTVSLASPMALNSAQSLTFQPSASGSSMLFAAGYTIT